MSFADIRFDFIAASMAWSAARRLNGPSHPLVRQLASRLEFAQARLYDARRASSRSA